MDIQVMAELIVGLVFAAHKNPAIGAAQSFCHVWEQKEKEMSDTQKETVLSSTGHESCEPMNMLAVTFTNCLILKV